MQDDDGGLESSLDLWRSAAAAWCVQNDHVSKALLLEPEKPILEFCAIGTKVN